MSNLEKVEPKRIKYNININQKAIVDNDIKINLIEATIFNFVCDFIMFGSCEKKIVEDETYYWISYQYIIDSLPLLEIENKQVIARHIKKLVAEGMLKSSIKKSEGKTYFKIGERANALFFDFPQQKSQPYLTEKLKGIDSKVEGKMTEKLKDYSINNSLINPNINSSCVSSFPKETQPDVVMSAKEINEEANKIKSDIKNETCKHSKSLSNLFRLCFIKAFRVNCKAIFSPKDYKNLNLIISEYSVFKAYRAIEFLFNKWDTLPFRDAGVMFPNIDFLTKHRAELVILAEKERSTQDSPKIMGDW